MFKFFKKKLKSAVEKFSNAATEESEVVEPTEEVEDIDENIPQKETKSLEKEKSKTREEDLDVLEKKDSTIEKKGIAVEKEDLVEDREERVEEDIKKESDLINKEEAKIPAKLHEATRDTEDKVEESSKKVEKIDEADTHNVTKESDFPLEKQKKDTIKVSEKVIVSDKKEASVIKADNDVSKSNDILDVTKKDIQEVTESKETSEELKEEGSKRNGFLNKLFKRKDASKSEESDNIETEDTVQILDSSSEETKKEDKNSTETKEKQGLFGKITQKLTQRVLSEDKFEELFFELEVVLLENNAALEVIEKIKEDLKKELVNKPFKKSELLPEIEKTLQKSINELFTTTPVDLVELAKTKKPFKIMFVGINGSGKTTTIAKVAYLLKQNGLSVTVAAADTFRAAAIEQLGTHATNLGIKMIKHDYNADPAAVAFDAIKYAEAKDKDVVLIDTAGRLHSNKNLIDEMKKIERVAKPDFTIFIGESITGNDCVEQAQKFSEAVNIDGLILSKADIDEKGGAAISVSYVTKKPILYLGIGQEYADLEKFNKQKVLTTLGFEA